MLAYSRSQTRVDHLVIKLHVTPMAFYIYGEGDYQLGTKIQKSMKQVITNILYEKVSGI